MTRVKRAYTELFPSKQFKYSVKEEYNRRLADYNANISLQANTLTIKYNLKWKQVDEEIHVGLIQYLLLRLLAKPYALDARKITTFNLDLYNSFIRSIPKYSEVQLHDSVLQASFERVNNSLLSNALERPNLKWGTFSTRRLASYDFHSNTVTVSKVFENAPSHVLDLLMYHELLHKQQQFSSDGSRTRYHDATFRRAEALYPHKAAVEKEIDQIIRAYLRSGKAPRKRAKRGFFDQLGRVLKL